MTLTNMPSRFSQVGNGATQDFVVNFPFRAPDLVVTLTDPITGIITYQLLNSDYTLEGSSNDGIVWDLGAAVVFAVAPTQNTRVTIWRDPPLEQTLNLTENNSMPAEALEAQFDYVTMLAQRVSEQVNRTVRQPDADGPPLAALPSASLRANKYLYFNALGEIATQAGPIGTVAEAVGAWTPSVGGSANYTVQLGRYVKVGTVVTLTCYLWINAIGSGSVFQISGMPFAPLLNTPVTFPVMFTGLTAPVVSLVAYVVPGSTLITLESHTAASTGLSPLGVLGSGSQILFSGSYLT